MGGMGAGMMGMGMLTEGISSALSAKMDRRAQKRAMRHQIHMAKNKYQYAVGDLRAAGLNPILAVGGGVSGATPSAPGAAGSSPARFGQYVSSAIQARTQRRMQNEQFKLMEATRNKEHSLEAQAYWQGVLNRQNVNVAKANERLTNANATLAETTVPSAKAAEALYKNHPWLRAAKEIIQTGRGLRR